MAADSPLHSPSGVAGFDPHSSQTFDYRSMFGDWGSLKRSAAPSATHDLSRHDVGLTTPEHDGRQSGSLHDQMFNRDAGMVRGRDRDAFDRMPDLDTDLLPEPDANEPLTPRFRGRKGRPGTAAARPVKGNPGLVVALIVAGIIGVGIWSSSNGRGKKASQSDRADRAFHQLDTSDRDALAAYLQRYPRSGNAWRVRQMLEELKEAEAVDLEFYSMVMTPTVATAREFIESHPFSPRVDLAQEIIKWASYAESGLIDEPMEVALDSSALTPRREAARRVLDRHYHELYGHLAVDPAGELPDSLPGRAWLAEVPPPSTPTTIMVRNSKSDTVNLYTRHDQLPYRFQVLLSEDVRPELPRWIRAETPRQVRVVIFRRVLADGQRVGSSDSSDVKISLTVTWTAVDVVEKEVLGTWTESRDAPADYLIEDSTDSVMYIRGRPVFRYLQNGRDAAWIPDTLSEEERQARNMRVR